MTRTEANAVARDMERCGYVVMSIRRNGGDEWAVEAHANGNMRPLVIEDEAQWSERKFDAGIAPTPTAGRPPVYGTTMEPHTIRMTAAQWAHVRQQGGDYSAGARAIVQRDMEGEGR